MRAVRIHELTGPGAVRIDEVAEPGPPGAGSILVGVEAAGVNFPDVLLSYGKYQFKPAAPFVPGAELAGVVRAVGPGVTAFSVGDRVAATLLHGAFAELVEVPELAAVRLPEAVSFPVGAATLLAYATTYHAFVDRAALGAGETVLVLGASGGIGVASIQLAKYLGATVIAAASTDEKVAFCKAQGADLGINYARESLKDRTKQLTSGQGVDVIVDAVGGAYSEAALRAIAWEGRHLVVGFAAGDIPKIPLNLALLKGCQIVGVFWGQFTMRQPEKNREHAVVIMDAVATGKLSPPVDAVYGFEEASAALVRMERREVKGKLVLVPR